MCFHDVTFCSNICSQKYVKKKTIKSLIICTPSLPTIIAVIESIVVWSNRLVFTPLEAESVCCMGTPPSQAAYCTGVAPPEPADNCDLFRPHAGHTEWDI